jgi:prepilin-type N-terminal cleavage/methylation domain-containing protein
LKSDRRHRAPRAGGFSLIELGVVIAVGGILAAAILPDVIEAARTRMAEKAAQDVAHIHDASKWFFEESGAASVANARWPGEVNASNVPTPGQCRTGTGAQTPNQTLITAGYLGAAAFTNPWGQAYTATLVAGAAVPTNVCRLRVTTNVPTAVRNALIAFLPDAACSGCGGTPPTGFSRCCSTVPKPGSEAALTFLRNQWIPTNVYEDLDTPLATVTGAIATTRSASCSGVPGGPTSCCVCARVTDTPVKSHPPAGAAGTVRFTHTAVNPNCRCGFSSGGCGGSRVGIACP